GHAEVAAPRPMHGEHRGARQGREGTLTQAERGVGALVTRRPPGGRGGEDRSHHRAHQPPGADGPIPVEQGTPGDGDVAHAVGVARRPREATPDLQGKLGAQGEPGEGAVGRSQVHAHLAVVSVGDPIRVTPGPHQGPGAQAPLEGLIGPQGGQGGIATGTGGAGPRLTCGQRGEGDQEQRERALSGSGREEGGRHGGGPYGTGPTPPMWQGDAAAGPPPAASPFQVPGRLAGPAAGPRRVFPAGPRGRSSTGAYSTPGPSPGAYSTPGPSPGAYSTPGTSPGAYSTPGPSPGAYSTPGP